MASIDSNLSFPQKESLGRKLHLDVSQNKCNDDKDRVWIISFSHVEVGPSFFPNAVFLLGLLLLLLLLLLLFVNYQISQN